MRLPPTPSNATAASRSSPPRTACNPDLQNDNGWDQGLLFLNPSQVWLQPPGYVTQMFARNYLPQLVKCVVADGQERLDVVAKRSADGKTLVLQVVNVSDKAVTSKVNVAGFVPEKTFAKATILAGPLAGTNTAENPNAITPKQSEWNHGIKAGQTTYTFLPHSFTVLRFE